MINTYLLICTVITSSAAVIGVIVSLVTKARNPSKVQNERIDALEQGFDSDRTRLNSIEESNRITQMAILALMSHALSGNDVDKLKEAKTSLELYLIDK